MALDSRSLDILIAKDSLLDPHWIDNDTIAFLQDDPETRRLQIHIATASQTRCLSHDQFMAPALPYGNGRILANEKGILAFQSPMTLVHYPKGKDKAEILQHLPPSGELSWGPQGTFVSWIQSESQAKDTVVTYSLADKRQHPLISQDGYIRSVAWNTQRPLFAYLSWGKDQLPWHSARLILASYSLQCSVPKLEGSAELFPPGLSEATVAELLFTPCGQYLIASVQSDEFFQIWRYGIESQTWVQLTVSTAERALPLRKVNRRCLAIDPLDKSLLSLVCNKGYWTVERVSWETPKATVTLPCSSTSLRSPSFSADGNQLLLVGSAARQVPSILRFQRQGQDFRPLNAAPSRGFSLQGEAVSWPGASGQTVHGILYRDRSRTTPSPLLMPIHGGPTDFVDATWPAKAQVFVQQGYALLYVNYRGSWGYGRSYQCALEGRWGQLEVDDCAAAVQSLASLGWIDPTRVALWGGGTASYSVLWGLIRYPELFRAGIAVFPLCNLENYLARCSAPLKAELGWALGSKANLQEKSPLSQAHRIRSPLALFHGGQDPLTRADDVEALAASLKERKVPCWLTVYPDEGNSWRTTRTYEDYYFKIASFLARFLRFRDN